MSRPVLHFTLISKNCGINKQVVYLLLDSYFPYVTVGKQIFASFIARHLYIESAFFLHFQETDIAIIRFPPELGHCVCRRWLSGLACSYDEEKWWFRIEEFPESQSACLLLSARTWYSFFRFPSIHLSRREVRVDIRTKKEHALFLQLGNECCLWKSGLWEREMYRVANVVAGNED